MGDRELQPDTTDLHGLLKLDNQLCFMLYALSRRMTALYRPLLEPLGITYPQYLVFLVLWEAQEGVDASHFDGVPVKFLCARLHLDTGTVTPLLKRMEAEGWLSRERSRDDEREVRVKLSGKGMHLREAAVSIPVRLLCESGAAPADIIALRKQLAGLLGAL